MSAVFIELKRLIARSPESLSFIAKECRLNQTTLQLWLDGKIQEPRFDSLRRVAAYFGRRIELSGGEARIVPDTPASVAIKAARAREFIGFWRRYQ